MPLAADEAALQQGARATEIEALRASGEPTPYSGKIEDPEVLQWLAEEMGEARIWSPTQIEAYARCPWSYFSGRLLRLEKLEDPDLDLDPRTRGSILHDALKRFYDAAIARTGGPVCLREPDLEWAVPLVETALEGAIQAARSTIWIGHPALERQRFQELKRQLVGFIEWEADQNEEARTRSKRTLFPLVRTGVSEHEVSFDDLPLEIDGVRLRLRGSIDRVETGIDERGNAQRMVAAVDYKNTRYSTPGRGDKKAWDDGVVLQVPLYALALTRIRPDVEPALVEYRAIKNRERVHTLPLYRYNGGELVEDAAAREKYDTALTRVARHIRGARGGHFPVDPPPSCNCPAFCHARDICRIPGGPRSGW
jgi:ATP-dependent helicase/nuclease subunit B